MICMYEDYNYHDILKEYAENISGKWFKENYLQIVGTKTVDDYMYVKGFDGGFGKFIEIMGGAKVLM